MAKRSLEVEADQNVSEVLRCSPRAKVHGIVEASSLANLRGVALLSKNAMPSVSFLTSSPFTIALSHSLSPFPVSQATECTLLTTACHPQSCSDGTCTWPW